MTRNALFDEQETEHKGSQQENTPLPYGQLVTLANLTKGVIHEFNNVLTAIETETSLGLMKLPDGHPLAPRLESIYEAVEHGASLIRQIQTFAEYPVAKRESVHLNEVIRALEGLLRKYLGAPVDLTLELADTLPVIKADRASLERLLVHLTMRAKQVVSPGDTLTLRTASMSPSESELSTEIDADAVVILEMHDPGQMDHTATESPTAEADWGEAPTLGFAGIGFQVVREVVEEHQGTVRVDSTPEHGTRIRCIFPTESEDKRKGDGDGKAVNLEGKHCLLVEDDVNLQRILREFLTHYGMTVDAAVDGEEAWQVFEQSGEQIDMIITDVVLPGELDGWTLFERVRAAQPDMRVIFTSGQSWDELPEPLQRQTEVPLIRKPFQPNQIIHALQGNDSEMAQTGETGS